jgi:predicted kinase
MTVFVVTGPPAAGKTTWVREHAKPGDITIDYDTLAQALSPELASDPADQPKYVTDVVMAARSAAIDEATYGSPITHDVYLVHSMPGRQHLNRYRKYGFEVITIDPGYTECMRRAQDERTPRQVEQVHEWYERRGHA